MFVRPLDGPATCPSNPPTPYTLRLDRPLGDRTLADGGTIPPRPVRGRLTRRGYQRAISRIVDDSAETTRLYDNLVVRPRPVATCSRLMWDFTGRVGRLLERVARLDSPPTVADIQRAFLGRRLALVAAPRGDRRGCGGRTHSLRPRPHRPHLQHAVDQTRRARHRPPRAARLPSLRRVARPPRQRTLPPTSITAEPTPNPHGETETTISTLRSHRNARPRLAHECRFAVRSGSETGD